MDSTYLHIGRETQLFVDNCLLECTYGLTRRWHKPVRRRDTPLITQNRLWE